LNEQKHIINRQVLELTIPGRDRAQLIQNKTSEILRHKLNPELDAIFSKLAGKDEIIRIDKLVIDLGTIVENELENDFVERAVNEIRNKITGHIKSGAKDGKETPVNGKTGNISSGFASLTKSKDILDQFVYFLQFGYFPWWYIPPEKNTIPVTNRLEDIFTEILKYDKIVLKNAIFPFLKKHSVRQRFVYQFNSSQLDSFFVKINEKLFESYSALLKILISCVGSAALKKTLTANFYNIVLDYFSVEKELKSDSRKIGFMKDILDSVLLKLSNVEKESVLAGILSVAQLKQQKPVSRNTLLIMATVIQSAAELHSSSQPLKEIIQNIPQRNEPLIKNLVEHFILKAEKDTAGIIIEQKEELEKGVKKLSRESEQESEGEMGDKSFSFFPPSPSIDAKEIVVSNAGLVLIHPFLRYFFEG